MEKDGTDLVIWASLSDQTPTIHGTTQRTITLVPRSPDFRGTGYYLWTRHCNNTTGIPAELMKAQQLHVSRLEG